MNAQEKKHIARVVSLGCAICGAEAVPHHIRSLKLGSGAGKKASHYHTIGLCPMHHTDGGYGTAYHAGAKEWERRFGTQESLLEQVKEQLEATYGTA